jgi:16S rRNA processing protein RimM
MDTPKALFILGSVGAPFGLKGFVKLKTFSGETGHFYRLAKMTLRLNGKEETRNVAELVPRGDSLLMRFEGIESPEAAAALGGAEIIAEREYAAPLKEGEFYVEDLKGLEAIAPGGESLGRISGIAEGGGGNLAELTLPSGEKRFAPFRKEFFGDPDFEKGIIALLEPWILE